MPYVDSDEILDILGWDSADATLLAQIDIFSPIAEEIINEYCNTEFSQEIATAKTYSGDGTNILSLKKYASAITSVFLLDSDGNQTGSSIEISLHPKNSKKGVYSWLQMKDGSLFDKGEDNYLITGTWGFSEIPQIVKLSVAFVCKHLMQMRDENDTFQYENYNNKNTSKFETIDLLPRAIKLGLDKWKFVPVFLETV